MIDPYQFSADQPDDNSDPESDALGVLIGFCTGLSNDGVPYTEVIGMLRTAEHVLLNTHCSISLSVEDET